MSGSDYCAACGVDGHLGSAQRKKAHRAFEDGKRFGNSQVGTLLFRAMSKDKAAFDRGAVRAE